MTCMNIDELKRRLSRSEDLAQRIESRPTRGSNKEDT